MAFASNDVRVPLISFLIWQSLPHPCVFKSVAEFSLFLSYISLFRRVFATYLLKFEEKYTARHKQDKTRDVRIQVRLDIKRYGSET